MFYDADRAIKDVTLRLLEPEPSAVVLDCGPGDCVFAREIQRRVGTSTLHVADKRPNRVALAKRQGWESRYSDLNYKIPYDDEYFDVVHAGQLIEHLNDTDTFVKEIRRTLKPGGYCVLSTPNLASWHNVLWLVMGKQPHVAMVSDEIVRWKLADEEIDEPKHRRLFTIEGLTMLLEHHGLAVGKSHGAGYYPLFGLASSIASRLDKRHAAYVVVKARRRL